MEQAELVADLRDWLLRQREWAAQHDPMMASRLVFWIQACRDAATRLENASPGTRKSAALDVDALLEKAFAFAQANALIGAPGRRSARSSVHDGPEDMLVESRFGRH